jgi:hypothetical protein
MRRKSENGRLVTPTGAGVRVEAELAFDLKNLLPDEDGAVEETHKQTAVDHLQPGQWWWD